jgi:hypothetical protein
MVPRLQFSITTLRIAFVFLAMVAFTSATVLPTGVPVAEVNELVPLPTFILAPPALTSLPISTPSSISAPLPYEPSTVIIITTITLSVPAPTPMHIYSITSPKTDGDLFSSDHRPNNPNSLTSSHNTSNYTWLPYATPVSWIILCVDLILFLGLWFLYAAGCIDRRFTPTSRCCGLRETGGRNDYLATPREIRSMRAEREWRDRREVAVYEGELRSPRERVEGLEGEMRRMGML